MSGVDTAYARQPLSITGLNGATRTDHELAPDWHPSPLRAGLGTGHHRSLDRLSRRGIRLVEGMSIDTEGNRCMAPIWGR